MRRKTKHSVCRCVVIASIICYVINFVAVIGLKKRRRETEDTPLIKCAASLVSHHLIFKIPKRKPTKFFVI